MSWPKRGYIAPLCLCVAYLALAGCNNDARDTSAHGESAVSSVDVGPLQTFCAQCHVPPSPKLHTADEWPAVVRRMEHHRMDARMPPVPDAERKTLLAWLQSHAH